MTTTPKPPGWVEQGKILYNMSSAGREMLPRTKSRHTSIGAFQPTIHPSNVTGKRTGKGPVSRGISRKISRKKQRREGNPVPFEIMKIFPVPSR